MRFDISWITTMVTVFSVFAACHHETKGSKDDSAIPCAVDTATDSGDTGETGLVIDTGVNHDSVPVDTAIDDTAPVDTAVDTAIDTAVPVDTAATDTATTDTATDTATTTDTATL